MVALVVCSPCVFCIWICQVAISYILHSFKYIYDQILLLKYHPYGPFHLYQSSILYNSLTFTQVWYLGTFYNSAVWVWHHIDLSMYKGGSTHDIPTVFQLSFYWSVSLSLSLFLCAVHPVWFSLSDYECVVSHVNSSVAIIQADDIWIVSFVPQLIKHRVIHTDSALWQTLVRTAIIVSP